MLLDSSVMSDDSDISPTVKTEVTSSPLTHSPSSDPLALGAVEVVTLGQGSCPRNAILFSENSTLLKSLVLGFALPDVYYKH